jgi:AcrR family transcriptional regulator
MPVSTRRRSAHDRLLEAAADLFYAEGYGVSVEAIAEHAGVAKPTVYAHFASKEALIEAVLRSSSDGYFADLDDELERRAGDPEAQLTAPFDLLVKGLPDPSYHGCICVNSAATFPAPTHPAHRVLKAHEERMLEIFERLATAAGAAHPAELARRLLLLYDGVKTRGLVDFSGAAADDARAAAMALLNTERHLASIGGRRPSTPNLT